jgi:hypothetical protein
VCLVTRAAAVVVVVRRASEEKDEKEDSLRSIQCCHYFHQSRTCWEGT